MVALAVADLLGETVEHSLEADQRETGIDFTGALQDIREGRKYLAQAISRLKVANERSADGSAPDSESPGGKAMETGRYLSTRPLVSGRLRLGTRGKAAAIWARPERKASPAENTSHQRSCR